MKKWVPAASGLLAGFMAATVFFADFSPGPKGTASSDNNSKKSNAEKVYVPYGELDEYYMLSSGGHSGQLFVYGLPSMRKIRTVPVFSPDPATGYGFDKDSKEMLGKYTWGDFHHPAISETNAEYDGKFLFANDVANNRIAAVDLSVFHTADIMEMPNMGGPHAGTFVTQNTEYIVMPTRFSVPIGKEYAPLDEFEEKYKGVVSMVTFDQKKKNLDLAYQIMLPPWSYDLSDAGKKMSGDWIVMTTYNTEFATTNNEINASQNDRDYIVLLNWKELEKKVAAGEFEEVNGAKMIDPRKHKGSIYAVPVAKSPHGVDVTPDGTRFIASGKLAPLMTVFSFEKAFEAIKSGNFETEKFGIPVLPYDKVVEREVDPPGALGPLHTQFDDRGNAYNTMFISSEIVKWKIDTGEILDRTPVHYSPGHSTATEGDTASPDGKWIVSLNKIAKDNFLSVGPSHPESMELIDISGDKMSLTYTAPVDPEPHYAQTIHRDKIKTLKIYEKDVNRENSVWKQEDTRIERKGNEVHVYGIAMRSKFVFDAKAKRPDEIKVNQGDKVVIHLTNIDLDQDITHGFGIMDHDLNYEVQPGQTSTIEFTADKAGTFPIYCTNFCSALHQEMSGYLLVEPK
ncbi:MULTISPECIES: Sec-dependent nitrous-oxide reductase [Bacillaceae]|uniref:Sec-dependent nitrous-oxide reductase n=1 Tax=Bacillaceae TaxID=186817 RepID=UPI0011A2AEB9|nr:MULTISPECIES: Sec-dependent nitrous-oxide reductase [Bacillaceae]MCM3123664.1 Sec-dependent nitrous-oxide reductase [Mesobacillus sp. MER 33]MCM3234321.1 Sec-dependent nitrous-oxide reductase [Mesobacillus sp. MER 48]